MALLHHHRPDLVDVANLQEGDALVNCSKAFRIAEVSQETKKVLLLHTQYVLLRRNLESPLYWIPRIWLLPPRYCVQLQYSKVQESQSLRVTESLRNDLFSNLEMGFDQNISPGGPPVRAHLPLLPLPRPGRRLT